MAHADVRGASLYVEEHGEGPPLLLIHGTGAHSILWEPVIDGLARDFHVIAYDRRGFGRSDGSAGSFHDHVKDAAALLEQLDASPAAVLGWSAGGVLAASLGADHPDQVSSLVLVEPPLHLITHPTPAALSMLARSAFARHVRRDKQAAAATMYRWASGLSTGGNTFDRLPEEMHTGMLDNAEATLREMDQQTLPYPRASKLRSIRCPIRLVIGDLSDSAFHRAGSYAQRVLPDADLVRLAGAGHFPQIEQPEAWLETVRAALLPATEPVAV